MYLDADSLPPGVAERWTGRARAVAAGRWRALPDRDAGMLFTLGTVLRAGPFVRLTVDWRYRDHGAGRLTRVREGGLTVYLLQVDGGWAVARGYSW